MLTYPRHRVLSMMKAALLSSWTRYEWGSVGVPAGFRKGSSGVPGWFKRVPLHFRPIFYWGSGDRNYALYNINSVECIGKRAEEGFVRVGGPSRILPASADKLV